MGGASSTLLFIHTSPSSSFGYTVSLSSIYTDFQSVFHYASFRENCKFIFSLLGVIMCADWECWLLFTVELAVKLL